jgi:hypothetical protein
MVLMAAEKVDEVKVVNKYLHEKGTFININSNNLRSNIHKAWLTQI